MKVYLKNVYKRQIFQNNETYHFDLFFFLKLKAIKYKQSYFLRKQHQINYYMWITLNNDFSF